MRPQFTTPQINKHTVGTQGTTQQLPMQLFQQAVQIPSGISQAQIKAPCNSNLAIIEDLPSMEIRQKIIFKIEEEIKKSGNPKMVLKSSGELESLAYSKSKTRTEYFRYLARIFAGISYSKSPTGQQQCQAANVTSQSHLRPSPPINKQQAMSNIGAQNASNQYPTQQIQQADKISSSSSQVNAMTICTSNSTTDKDLPSMAVCQRIIPQIEEQLRRYWNPNISIKSPEERESQAYSEVKTKVEYRPMFTEVKSRPQKQQVTNVTPTQFPTHSINRRQVMMSTVGVQGTTQQLQMQRFQQNAQVPSSLSRESHVIAPCNSYLATNRDWPSV